MSKGIYSPRLDLAVGPFAIEDNVRLNDIYLEMMAQTYLFLNRLVLQHLLNIEVVTAEFSNADINEAIENKMHELYESNINGRCFISIEIENESSRKHLMGGAVNASALGKIGIAVGHKPEMHNAFLNLYRYFSFLRNVDKPTFNLNNLLIVSSNQLLEITKEVL